MNQNRETQEFYKLQAQLEPAAQMMGSCQSLPVNSAVGWHHSQAIVAIFSSPTSNATEKKKSNFPSSSRKVSQCWCSLAQPGLWVHLRKGMLRSASSEPHGMKVNGQRVPNGKLRNCCLKKGRGLWAGKTSMCSIPQVPWGEGRCWVLNTITFPETGTDEAQKRLVWTRPILFVW